jgi:broad specificity phosphatase PhoE
MKRIILVRHGESEGNVNNSEYYNKLDCHIELTEKGREQMHTTSIFILNLLYGERIDLIYSPYHRTKECANILKSYFSNVSMFREQPLIRERNWQGLRQIIDNGELEKKKHFNFFWKGPSGESLAECYQRAVIFDLWLNTQETEDNVIIISHGEWINCYLMHKLGWTVEEFDEYKTLDNAEYVILDVEYTPEVSYLSKLPNKR